MVKALLFVVLLGIIGGSSGFRFGRSWGDPAWYYQRLVWRVGVACLFAWEWVAKSVLVLPSPVHRVQFYDERGQRGQRGQRVYVATVLVRYISDG